MLRLSSGSRLQHAASNLSSNVENNKRHYLLTKNSSPESKDKELKLHSSESPRLPRVISRERLLPWYMGILGYVSIQTKSRFADDAHNTHTVDKQFVSEERIVVLRPSFWKTDSSYIVSITMVAFLELSARTVW